LLVYLFPTLADAVRGGVEHVDFTVVMQLVTTITPDNIVDFLIHRDLTGDNRTQVHDLACEHLGKKGRFPCGCRIAMAHGTLDSLIGRLSRGFKQVELDKEYVLGQGNPTRSFAVREYSKFIMAEQCDAHVFPKQAVVMFLRKMVLLCRYLTRAVGAQPDPVRALILQQDLALICLIFARGKRPGDAIQLNCQTTMWLPDQVGILFNVMVGKTLRDGFVDIFVLMRERDPCMFFVDAVPYLARYVEMSAALGVPMLAGPLFRHHDWRTSTLSTDRLTAAAINARFIRYMIAADQYEQETLYSLRSGQGLQTIFQGADLRQTMDKIGWRTEKTAEHYLRLRKLLAQIYDFPAHSSDELSRKFEQLNTHQGFVLLGNLRM
jgi:hypothetical protein